MRREGGRERRVVDVPSERERVLKRERVRETVKLFLSVAS